MQQIPHFELELVLKALSCTYCDAFLHHPVTDHNGHSFCLSCVDFKTPIHCPACAQPVNKWTRNRVLEQVLDQLRVSCDSCQWVGPATEYNAHLQQCRIKYFQLDNICQNIQRLLQSTFSAHFVDCHQDLLPELKKQYPEMRVNRGWDYRRWLRKKIICVTCIQLEERVRGQLNRLDKQRREFLGVQTIVID